MNWRAAANTLLSSLFEPPCAACSGVLPHPLDGAVCEACWARVRLLASPPSGFVTNGRSLDALCAIGEYEGCLRDIIHALKYERRRSIAPTLGALMRAAGAHLLHDADVVVPVPLHPRRQRVRGFNQAEDLARALGPPVSKVLKRVVATVPQVDLPAAERHRNVRDAFRLAVPTGSALPTGSAFPTIPWLIPTRMKLPAVFVLVDDVSTTGATLDACARVLKAAGAREVRAVTAARVATAWR
ncbi:MAG: ComF family protein [Vicinamibacterales bacterium]